VTVRATVFDMDGLLIDSEVLWHRAEVEIFGELGVPITLEQDRSTKGMYVDEVVAFWHARYPWSGRGLQDVSDALLARVGELIESEGRLLPGATRAIALARERGPVALASSTPRPLIERSLRHFGLWELFTSVHSADVEPFGKPHPGVFLTAAAALGLSGPACLVFEDSAAGVLAAKAGRMRVVAVPVAEDRGEVAFVLADLVLDSLAELSEEWLDEQFSQR
jgi:mannitol-1-/sugar-/sorbitol-6-/2-deoxyglucose-6-phosphatase